MALILIGAISGIALFILGFYLYIKAQGVTGHP
jgi:hypothetical protein